MSQVRKWADDLRRESASQRIYRPQSSHILRTGDTPGPDRRRDGPNLGGEVLAVLAVLTADILGVDAVDELALYIKQLHGSPAVAAVPQPVVALDTIRGFVIDQQHILLLAGDIGHHPSSRTLYGRLSRPWRN